MYVSNVKLDWNSDRPPRMNKIAARPQPLSVARATLRDDAETKRANRMRISVSTPPLDISLEPPAFPNPAATANRQLVGPNLAARAPSARLRPGAVQALA